MQLFLSSADESSFSIQSTNTNTSVSGVMVSDSVAETVAFEANSLLTLSMENYDFKDRLVFRMVHITLRYRKKILKYTIDECDHFLCFFDR